MRPFFLLCLSVLLSTSLAPYTESTFSSLDQGLVAYFSFNSCDARDDSGNGSYGILKGNVNCWCGVEDEGLLLDGQSAYIEFQGPVNDYFTTSDFTLSFYFKPEARSVFPLSLLSKREDCGEDHFLDILLNFTQDEVTTHLQQSAVKYFSNLSPAPAEGNWMHFALVREGVYARTYINGTLQRESRRCSGIDISNDAPLSIGNSPCIQTGRARRFRGVLDELRVYDRALKEDEIKTLYELFPVENAQMDCVS